MAARQHPDVRKSNAEAMKGEEPKLTKLAPHWSLADVARHAADFWLTTEDVPKPDNRVLDATCKAHELDNLYVVDTSVFPSIGAVNPALTAMANAIRVGEQLLSWMS